MNLYKLHSDPKSLDLHDEARESIPHIFWGKYKNSLEELKKREDAIAKDSKYAYQYANDIIKGPFPKGEDSIATDSDYAYSYAEDVLKGPFPKAGIE